MARRLPLKANLSMGGASRGASANKSTRIAKAKKAAKARVTQAKGRLKVAKEGRASQKRAKAKAKLDASRAGDQGGQIFKRSQEHRIIDRAHKATDSSPTIQGGGKRVVSAQKNLKRARTTASTPVKPSTTAKYRGPGGAALKVPYKARGGGGRRTHFLDGDS